MKTCKTCKFWMAPLPGDDTIKSPDWECILTETVGALLSHPATLAYAVDDNEYGATLMTNKDFGCNQWRSK